MPSKKTSSKKTPSKKVAQKATKKAAPEKVTKKTSVKKPASKTTTKKVAQYELRHAPTDQAFWVTDGQILNNLLDLESALSAMEKAVFSHHVTKEKNDFADWVEYVLEESECAQALRKARTQKPAHTVVVRYVKRYV